MKCLDLPASHRSKRRFVHPLAYIGPPEPKNLDLVLAEAIQDLKRLALSQGHIDKSGIEHRVFAVGYESDSRGRQHVQQMGGPNLKSPDPGCRTLALLREPGSSTCYPGGYAEPLVLWTSEQGDYISVYVGDPVRTTSTPPS